VKVLFLLSKRQPPSARIRIVNSIPIWQEHGVEATVVPIPSGLSGRLNLLKLAKQHDVVLIQKKTSFRGFELKQLRKANPNIVFDYDDAVMFHELEHHKPIVGKHFKKFIRTIDHCAAVVAGNRFLARFAEANCPNTHVIPTPVDIKEPVLRDWSQAQDKVIVGWLGVAGNLHYLEELAPVFQRLANRYPNFYLKIVSNDFIDIEGVNVIKEKWSLEGQAAALASFDVGIMPLKDNLWSWGKCGYKILQYFGAGVPAVASPVGINMEFVQNGKTGFLAQTQEDWEQSISTFLESRDLNKQCGLNGYAYLAENHTQENFAIRYLSVMQNLIDHRKVM